MSVSILQSQLDSYWSGRAADYHDHQVSGPRAPLDRQLWSTVFGSRLGGARGGEAPDVLDVLDVLDVGTGSGYLANLLASAGHRVTGVDSSAGMIAVAGASGGGARFDVGDAHDPQVGGVDGVASVDAVVSRYVLWTLPDPVAAARAWRRMLRPGGVVVAVDATWFPHGVDPSMKVPSADGEDAFTRTYSTSTLDALPLATAADTAEFGAVFREAGFASVEVDPLPEVAELDRRFGVAPGHESRPHVVVTARG
ncbi:MULTISPECIES: class I SAM-dependent methyltransferase [unclassified Corynebacterium]